MHNQIDLVDVCRKNTSMIVVVLYLGGSTEEYVPVWNADGFWLGLR
jgi:hypothetical protein